MAQKINSMIQVTDIRTGEATGRVTPEELRRFMGVKSAFIAALIKEFNEGKARCGEPERVEQIFVNRQGKRVL